MSKPKAAVVWFAVACGSLAGNVWLAIELHRSFADLQYARVFPLGPKVAVVPHATDDRRPLLAIYGDSRALMWDVSELAAKFRVLNLAQGGQTSAQLLAQLRVRNPVVSDWALVETGINDLHPIGALADREAAIRMQLKEDLAEIVDELRARSRCVIVATLVPPGPPPLERRWVWSNATFDALAETNSWIRGLRAPDGTLQILDADRLLRGSDGRLAAGFRLAGSFLHVNHAGYDALNRDLRRILVNSDKGTASTDSDRWARIPQSSAGSPCGGDREG